MYILTILTHPSLLSSPYDIHYYQIASQDPDDVTALGELMTQIHLSNTLASFLVSSSPFQVYHSPITFPPVPLLYEAPIEKRICKI